MKKKLFAVAILLAVFSFALVSFVSANTNMDNAVNGVRNFVGGAENVIEDAGQGAITGVKDGINAIGNGTRDMTNDAENGLNNDNSNANAMKTTGTSSDANNYAATRTSTRSATDTGTTGLFSTTNIWTWVVLAIVGAIIVGLVMYYAKQSNVTTYENNNND